MRWYVLDWSGSGQGPVAGYCEPWNKLSSFIKSCALVSSWPHNGDVLCFLWGTNWIYICYVEESRPPLWSSGQSSWLLIQRSGFDSIRYRIFWEVVGLERGPLSLVSTSEELLGRNSSGSGPEIREYGHGDPLSWPRDILYLQKLVLTSPTSGGLSVGIATSHKRPWTY
jgi:hypothetical protein